MPALAGRDEIDEEAIGGMATIQITMPDGSVREYEKGVTPARVAADIGPRLARGAVAAKLDGRLLGLGQPLSEGGHLQILTFNDEEGREVYRHSAAHVMAQAVKRLFPEARLAIGPAIEDGFYYDIDAPRSLSPEDLERIEAEMARIVQEDIPFERHVLDRDAALDFFRKRGEVYKVELIEDLPPDEEISLYRQGEFTDLCRGPHLPSTGRIKAFKLLGLAGAYWRGDEKRPMLQRIYGTAFDKKEDLEQFLWRREEAKKRDHRKLGPELDLFSFKEEAPGFCFWHPKGVIVYNALIDFSREVQARYGYQEVKTPPIMDIDLWKRSGHWDHYRDNMYFIDKEDEHFAVKPMNCPAHCLLYKNKIRSYRDLPLRISEYGQLARFERSGTLHGLLRVRGFVQDDAHLFVREDQIQDEIGRVLEILDAIYAPFQMPYHIKLSTRPDDYMGEPALWEKAEAALAAALEKAGRTYQLNPGDGAFYGPKLDFEVTDSLGRRWQCATVQLDFQLPVKFDLTYRDADGGETRPVMIHRAIMGSLERFIGILVEHYAGAFPVWLAPVQVKVLPIADRHAGYAREVAARLQEAAVRVEVDDRNEKIGARIRDAQMEKVPYMLVVGDKEAEAALVAVRSRRNGDEGAVPLGEFIDRIKREIGGRLP